MSKTDETNKDAFEPVPHPAAAPLPRFLREEDPSPSLAPEQTGLERLAERVKALLHRGERPAAPLPKADGEGAYELAAKSLVQAVPRLSGQHDDVAYCLVAQGFPLPPGGAAYLVSFDPGARLVEGALPARGIPGVLRTSGPARVRVLALVDEFGRVFACDELVSMSPARSPEVQLKRYPGSAARGCVDVASERGRVVRAAEYVETPAGIDLVNARVDLGGEAKGLSLCAACAAAFLALWAFPHRDGYSLASVGVRDVVAKLRSNDVFEAVGAVVGAVDEARALPLVAVPGFLSYMAQTLREAGLADIDASDLADGPGAGAAPAFAGLPLAPGVPLAQTDLPPSVPPQAAQVIRGIAEMIGSALAAHGLPGLTVLGPGAPGADRGGAPTVRLMRTAKYSNAFFIVFDRDEVSAEGARMLLEAEGLLNRFVMAVEMDPTGALQVVGEQDAAALDRWLVDQAATLAWAYMDAKVKKVSPAPDDDPDLGVRMAFARGCECLRLPYRLEYTFRYDADSGSLVADVECPSSAVMPRLDYDAQQGCWAPLGYAEREGLATRYAAFSLVAVAAVAFWAGSGVRDVVVNGWRGLGSARGVDELVSGPEARRGALGPGEPACVLTLRLGRKQFFESLSGEQGRRAFEQDPFAYIAGMRHSFGMDRFGHLTPVAPLATLDDPLYHGAAPELDPELDHRPLPGDAAARLGAACVEGLAVYEGVSRREEARGIMEAFSSQGHLAALAVARDACERTENPLVKAALNRVSEGIATDAITADSSDEVFSALGDIYGMQAQMEQAASVVQKDPAQARRILEELLYVADGNCWFVDSKTRKFRYFDSYAARAVYALRCPECFDGRELRLCADEYFMAHYRLSSLLDDTIDGGEEAIQHALRCVEIAPAVAAGHLRLARCYFGMFDYASEIEALKRAVKVVWNPKDLGLALYWLGYAFCMVDKVDAGIACYQRCGAYDRSLFEPAAAEAADILKKRDLEPRSFTEREAGAAIEAQGVDLAAFEENVEFLVKAAAAAQQAGNSGLASNLLSAAGFWLHDDALAPVLESLEA